MEPHAVGNGYRQTQGAEAGKVHNLSQWLESTAPFKPHHISPEGAVPTGQQVVEDIESGLAGWASGHTQLLQEHGLWHSRSEEEGSHSCYPQSSKPESQQGILFPGAHPPTTSPEFSKGRNQSHAKEESPRLLEWGVVAATMPSTQEPAFLG